MLVYIKTLHSLGARYLKDHPLPYISAQELRSQAEALLIVPSIKEARVVVHEGEPFLWQPHGYGTSSLGRCAWPPHFRLLGIS